MKFKYGAILFSILLIGACTGSEGGQDGTDGLTSLVEIGEEDAGENCTYGGQRLDSGFDADADGQLSEEEITITTYVCNGDVGVSTLVETTIESAGENCTAGGVRVDIGPDLNGDGTLDSEDITETRYICNGEDGADGVPSRVMVTDEPAGAECAAGGTRVDVGLDIDASGNLDAVEITDTYYICDGVDG